MSSTGSKKENLSLEISPFFAWGVCYDEAEVIVMKKQILLAGVLSCLLPALLTALGPRSRVWKTPETTPSEAQTQAGERVTVLTGDKATDMELETYLVGVVLVEMPADFEVEALKAQAVVARTYTRRRLLTPKHETGALCTDSACCQAYMPEAEYLQKGGTQEKIHRVRQAVEATRGEVLRYQGELIEATYFSCSGGRTEEAKAVWGTDVPYLQSVESPGEEKAAHYVDTVTFSVREFQEKLGLPLQTPAEGWIGAASYTAGGGVEKLQIGEKMFTGTELRQKLGLRSTAFAITCLRESITVTTKGFGHRVGMSQYGAEAMAVQGCDYREILLHYYLGTELADN